MIRKTRNRLVLVDKWRHSSSKMALASSWAFVKKPYPQNDLKYQVEISLASKISHSQHYTNHASGTFKYVVPRLTCHHEGAARVMTFQPRDNIFECSAINCASFVLSYDQLRASTKSRWIIYLRLCFTKKPKSKFPMCNCVAWLSHHHHISTYC